MVGSEQFLVSDKKSVLELIPSVLKQFSCLALKVNKKQWIVIDDLMHSYSNAVVILHGNTPLGYG